jgi:uncharacterized protein (DUF2236 family)
MATPRPVSGITPTPQPPADDGLFGPTSVTWRVMPTPAALAAIPAAVLLQMLEPRVAQMVDHAGGYARNPELRAQMTSKYGSTTIFGDTRAAENAGATLRRIHRALVATDPATGAEYHADEPDLLMWVHCTIVWSVLRACDRWGPRLSPTDRDRFVDEQRTAARLVGIDPATAPATAAALDAYMQHSFPRLAYTPATARIMAVMTPRGLPRSLKTLIDRTLHYAALDLLPPDQRALYGARWSRLHEGLVRLAAGLLFALLRLKMPPSPQLWAQARAQVQVHAFGARAAHLNTPAAVSAAVIPA